MRLPTPRFAMALMATLFPLLVAGCASDCDVDQPDAAVTLLEAKVDPPVLKPVLVDRASPLTEFSAENAVVATGLKGALHYNWYYDFSSEGSIPLPLFSTCNNSPRCYLAVCAKPNPIEKDHRLLLVVSHGPLAADAKTPFDFPEGTAFDSVQWLLELKGNCPGG